MCCLLQNYQGFLADVIIGMDILGQHGAVHLETGGKPYLSLSHVVHLAPKWRRCLAIEPPVVFPDKTEVRASPIVTKSRYNIISSSSALNVAGSLRR